MGIDLIPPQFHKKYRIYEWKHACAILANDYPEQWQDILENLDAFALKRSAIIEKGGRKSSISSQLDNFLYTEGVAGKAVCDKISTI